MTTPESDTCDVSDIRALFFVNNNVGWAVGDCGTILKTIDGAENWEEQESGTIASLESVYFIDQNRGWSVGSIFDRSGVKREYEGIILSTNDGGTTWVTLASGFGHALRDIFFVDENLGWAVGDHTIVRSDDGGRSWVSQTGGPEDWDSPLAGVSLNAVHFIDSETGWAVGNEIVKSENGGENWSIQEWAKSGNSDVQFVDHNLGYILTYDSVLKTINGGKSWEEYTILDDNPGGLGLTDLHFIDSDTGWAVGYGLGLGPDVNFGRSSAVFETKDGGVTWHAIWEAREEDIGHSNKAMWAFDTESVLVGGDEYPDSLILKIKE